jgi:acetyltransferase-like isoleucine patch superfamily enzyme
MGAFSQYIKRVFRFKRDRLKNRYNRVLPANELFTDRWEKAKYLGFGKGTSIYDSSTIFGDIEVGEHTWIGPFTILDGSGGLKIGSHCSISAGVQIYSHDTVAWAVSGGKAPYEYGEVIIESNCYIGPNTVIAKGVHLKKGTVVGANSFVNKSFEEGVKIAGSPAKIIN